LQLTFLEQGFCSSSTIFKRTADKASRLKLTTIALFHTILYTVRLARLQFSSHTCYVFIVKGKFLNNRKSINSSSH